MRHKVEAPGFEGHAIEIDAGMWRKTLWVDGNKAPSAGKLGQYRLRRNDGREVTTKWPSSFDPAPSIIIDGQLIRTAPPLVWYEWIMVGAPLLLVVMGGALGGLCGAVAAGTNAKLIRSSLAAPLRYLGSVGVTLLAITAYVLLAGALHLAVTR